MQQEQIVTQVVLSAIAAQLMEFAKRSPWVPWITQHSKWVNTLTASLLAAFTAAGMHFNYESTAGVITITGVTLISVLHFLWEWVQSFVFQHLIFKAAVGRQVPNTTTNNFINNNP